MKINDDQLKAALDIAGQALQKDSGDLNSVEKTAFLTIAKSVILDIRRIADALDRLAPR